jgi:diguanylate cyclase (GGDEF)-like protein
LLASALGASEAELVVRTADVQVRLGTGRPDHPAQGRREEVTVAAGAAHDGGQLCLWWPHAAVHSDPQLLSLSLPASAALLGCLLDSDLERAAAAERGEQASLEARTDALTGLGNRRAWEAALRTEASRARREQRALAVVVVDLDGLKLVNDAAGHLAGDDLLRKAGAVLTGGARITDTACRLGGDEFGVVGLVRNSNEAQRLAQRLVASFAEACVAASVGVAASTDQLCDDEALLALWAAADADMYRQKPRDHGA